jgi:tRNA threonylcarbamoyladenosine biosynthesis protein TsaB
MLVLAIDAALGATQACVFDAAAGRVRAMCVEPMRTGHAEALVPLVLRALADAGVGFDAIGRVAATVGPGSFTGVRVAVAAARAYGLALGAPVAGVSTLDAYAAADGHANAPKLVLIDARRGAVYARFYDAAGRPLGAPRARALEDVLADAPDGPLRILGPGATLAAGLRTDASFGLVDGWPPLEAVARLATQAAPSAALAPLYLRAPDAKPQGPPIARRA